MVRSLASQPIQLYDMKMKHVQRVVNAPHIAIFWALGLNLDNTIPEARIPRAEKTRPTTPVYKLKKKSNV